MSLHTSHDKFWVGVTDQGWYEFNDANDASEVNFWAPGGERSFSAIEENGLFLFKLKSPVNKSLAEVGLLKVLSCR